MSKPLSDPSVSIWIAEDDEDHFFLADKIMKESFPATMLHRLVDGEDLVNELKALGPVVEAHPDIIILDINMPRKDGWEALKEIKNDPNLRHIPIIVLTTSDVEEDKVRSYELGASSYIRKPIEFGKWVQMFGIINRYWFETVTLPDKGALK